MEKTVAFLLALCISAAVLTSCKSNKETVKKDIRTVVMVYMMGSDLESKAGAGSDDLAEMEESGIDLNSTELLVYTGGTTKWRNKTVDTDNNYVIRLGKKGFEKAETFSNDNMGDAKTLSSFLNYAYDHYKAKRFALVLWDHGNGPVIGYGLDTAHDKDALTLLEMKNAMNDSPFKGKNKLEWVGFDACLMSSAELAAVWADHAKYLVASQEIEPAGGWDYGSLSGVNTTDTPKLLTTVTDSYLKSCLDYFDSKGYEGREATLSCMDLSKASEMVTAVEDLFSKCAGDVEGNYDSLASLRVNTRSFGRASTGSEYDLVDLQNMAKQLEKVYPSEAKAVSDAVDSMIINNATNTPLSCGLSIYYPFYNKYYYQSGWSEEYGRLKVFPNYLSYLKKYEKNWLVEEDDVLKYASSVMPSKISVGKYSYELTEAQAKRYASCNYHILVKEGQDVYQRVFTSGEVELNDKTLVADFDGKIIYGKNKFDEYFIPDTLMLDRVGDYVRYSLRASASTMYENYPLVPSSTELRNKTLELNNEYNNEKFDFSRLEDFKPKTGYMRYVLAVDPKASGVSVSSIVPVNEKTTKKDLTSGKLKDFDLSKWTTIVFPGQQHCLLRRSDNGMVLPIDSWLSNGTVSHVETVSTDKVEFVYDYLTGGDYAIIFEITDTSGNKYCSEPIDLETKTADHKPYSYKEKDLKWDKGDSLKVFDEGGFSLEIKKSEKKKNKLVFKAVNKTGKDIALTVSDLVFNDKICMGNDALISYIPDGKQETDDIDINEDLLYELDKIRINAISFSVKTVEIDTRKEVVEKTYINLSLGDKTAWELDPSESEFSTYKKNRALSETFLGMNAQNKVIYDSGGVKLTLLRFGSETKGDDGHAIFRIENTSSKTVNAYVDSCMFDDIAIEKSLITKIYPGATVYEHLFFSESDMKDFGITSASSLTLALRFSDSEWNGWMGYGSYRFVSVPLDKKGEVKNSFKEGKDVLYDANGIRIALVSGADKNGNSRLSVINNGDKDVSIDVIAVKNGKELVSAFSETCYLTNNQFKAHSKGYCKFARMGSEKTGSVTVKFVINDYTGETNLFTGTKTVKIK